MSGRLLKRLRTNAYYKHLLAALAEFGVEDYEIVPATGRGHPMLKFDGHRIPLPGSPASGSRAQDYLRCEIKRRLSGRMK